LHLDLEEAERQFRVESSAEMVGKHFVPRFTQMNLAFSERIREVLDRLIDDVFLSTDAENDESAEAEEQKRQQTEEKKDESSSMMIITTDKKEKKSASNKSTTAHSNNRELFFRNAQKIHDILDDWRTLATRTLRDCAEPFVIRLRQQGSFGEQEEEGFSLPPDGALSLNELRRFDRHRFEFPEATTGRGQQEEGWQFLEHEEAIPSAKDFFPRD
jgi:hypothetical protein